MKIKLTDEQLKGELHRVTSAFFTAGIPVDEDTVQIGRSNNGGIFISAKPRESHRYFSLKCAQNLADYFNAPVAYFDKQENRLIYENISVKVFKLELE